MRPKANSNGLIRIRIQPVGKAQRKAVLNLAGAGLCSPGKPTVYITKLPETAFMKYSKERGGIMLEVNATGGEFDLTFHQEWEEEVYVRAFLQQLEQEGICYEVVRKEVLKVAAVEFISG